MVKTKMANPGPSTLMIVNPTGGKKMRKNTTRRRTTRKTTRRHHNHVRKFHARKRVNRPRHNPNLGTGLIFEGVTLAAGGGLTQFVAGMVPTFGGATPLADAARTAGVAYLLGVIAGKLGFGKYARAITLGGMAVAGGKLINSFLMPFASQVFMPRPVAAADTKSVKGIAMQYPGMNPFGLRGIAIQTPGQFPFSDYAPELGQ